MAHRFPERCPQSALNSCFMILKISYGGKKGSRFQYVQFSRMSSISPQFWVRFVGCFSPDLNRTETWICCVLVSWFTPHRWASVLLSLGPKNNRYKWGFSWVQLNYKREKALDAPNIYLLGQWLNFKLFGITYLVGKISLQTCISGFHSLSEYIQYIYICFPYEVGPGSSYNCGYNSFFRSVI